MLKKYMSVQINDKRQPNEFQNVSFSGYKKSDVKKTLLTCLLSNKIEDAYFWTAELFCAGHYLFLWDIIILFISKHIHLGNPKLPLYIEKKMNEFTRILNKRYQYDLLNMRNDENIRVLILEIITILCQSKKKNSYDCPKIKEAEYSINNISYKLKADSVDYAYPIFKKKDPKELLIAINEFAWNMEQNNRNTYEAIYWLEWVIGYEYLCKKNKNVIKKAIARFNMPVEGKFNTDSIWIIWELLLRKAQEKSKGVFKTVQSLLNLFCLRYKSSFKKRRKYLIYFAISLINERVDNRIKIVNDTTILRTVRENAQIIFKQIKKNEIKGKQKSLFGDIENLEE